MRLINNSDCITHLALGAHPELLARHADQALVVANQDHAAL